LRRGLRAGTLGLTTSRIFKHRAKDRRYTPGLTAMEPELAGLALAMKRAGSGVIEVNSDFGDGDFEKLRAAAEIAQRPLSVLSLQVHNAPDLWKDTLAGITAGRVGGQNVDCGPNYPITSIRAGYAICCRVRFVCESPSTTNPNLPAASPRTRKRRDATPWI
jgi:N-acyl-D-aspartate/D-glutamate deacylase